MARMPADTPRLPVVDIIESRDSTIAFDSKIINGIVEQGQQYMRAVKRAGMSIAFTGFGGLGQGLDAYNGTLFGVSGDVLNEFGTSSGFNLTQVTSNGGFGARDGAAMAGFLGSLYVIGGSNAGGLLNDAWKSVTGVTWSQVTSVPAALAGRTGAKAVVLNNVLYIMGGQNAAGGFLNDVWSTADGNTWTQILANAPWGARADFEVLVYGGAIYISGGQGVSSPNGYPDTGLYHDVWTTNNGTSWTMQNGSAPWIGRRRFGFFMTNAVMNVLGGFVSSGTNTTFANAVADQWQSTDFGVTWTRSSTNAFGVGGCPMIPEAIITSVGTDVSYGRPMTVTNGAGGAGAVAYGYAYGDEELYDDEWIQDHDINTVTFTTVGSGYTTACTFTDPGDGSSILVTGYGLLDGTAVSGGRGGEVVFSGGQYYYFTTYINGAQANEVWTSGDGVTWHLLTAAPGYATRSMQVFVYGNIWIIGGSTGGVTYFNDVWDIASASGQFPLSPTVANEFYYFNQTSTSLTTPLLVFASPHQAYTFNAALGVLTRITNANYPAVIVPGLVYLDTTFYVMDPQGRIWGSALNDPTTWTALNEIAIQNEPNGGVGICKVSTYLVAFGQWTVQFFWDAGNAPPGSVLSANISLQYQVGCVNGRTIVEAQGTCIWVGQTVKEGTKVYIMQGLAPQIISTPFIDRILTADSMQNVTAYITQIYGHPCYVLTLYQSGVTLVYDLSTQFWTQWVSSKPATPVNLTSTTITGVSSTAFAFLTVSTAPNSHGLHDGDPVQISGLPANNYNGFFNVNVVDQFTFTYVANAANGSYGQTGQVQGYSTGVFLPVTAHENGSNNIYYLQDPTNGNVYSVNYATGGDFGNPIDFSVVTGRWDGQTMYVKTVMRVSLIGDMTSSTCYIRNTKTDYQTWSAYRPVNMQAQWAFISALGQCSRIAYQIRHTAFSPQRFESIEHEFEMGV